GRGCCAGRPAALSRISFRARSVSEGCLPPSGCLPPLLLLTLRAPKKKNGASAVGGAVQPGDQLRPRRHVPVGEVLRLLLVLGLLGLRRRLGLRLGLVLFLGLRLVLGGGPGLLRLALL